MRHSSCPASGLRTTTQGRAEHGRAARRRTPNWTTRTITPRSRHHRGCTLLIRCSLQTRHATAPPPALDPAPSPGESPARPHPPCGPPQLPPRRPRSPPLPAQASTRRTNDGGAARGRVRLKPGHRLRPHGRAAEMLRRHLDIAPPGCVHVLNLLRLETVPCRARSGGRAPQAKRKSRSTWLEVRLATILAIETATKLMQLRRNAQ